MIVIFKWPPKTNDPKEIIELTFDNWSREIPTIGTDVNLNVDCEGDAIEKYARVEKVVHYIGKTECVKIYLGS